MQKKSFSALGLFIFCSTSFGALPQYFNNDDCDEMTVWDAPMGMCMPLAGPDMTMRMLMLRGNLFIDEIAETGPRGRPAFVVPNMVMADVGTTIGSAHYLNLDLMLTAEKWTFPSTGSPQLLQVGEENAQGQPYVDAQHPHSSPIMGLTLSDTIRLNSRRDFLKISFAPRGESTDGPVAYAQRPTGMGNPDVPLGHHVAQDVGHISSTVLVAALKWNQTRVEASIFNGTEPQPTQVDLPMGAPNSIAARIFQDFNSKMAASFSYAYVQNPEPNDPDIAFVVRYSASFSSQIEVFSNATLFNTFIVGLISNYNHAPTLISFGDEFWLRFDRSRIWGRAELLQRTPSQLEIDSAPSSNSGRFVGAITLGYSYALLKEEFGEAAIGGSVTANFVPQEFASAYGGNNPWGARVFVQLKGFQMWDL